MDYFGARYYRADSARFISVDPVMNVAEALPDPQRWNRYGYSRNNPIRFIDPDGADITTPAAFQQRAFMLQVGDHFQGVTSWFVRSAQSINLPGHMTPQAAQRHFRQPETPGQAAIMQFLDFALLMTAVKTSPTSMLGAITDHGSGRIAGQAATRGGTLTELEILAVRNAHETSYVSNVDGATALVSRTANGKFNIVIEGERGFITSYKTVSQKDLDRLAKKYQWDGYEHR